MNKLSGTLTRAVFRSSYEDSGLCTPQEGEKKRKNSLPYSHKIPRRNPLQSKRCYPRVRHLLIHITSVMINLYSYLYTFISSDSKNYIFLPQHKLLAQTAVCTRLSLCAIWDWISTAIPRIANSRPTFLRDYHELLTSRHALNDGTPDLSCFYRSKKSESKRTRHV